MRKRNLLIATILGSVAGPLAPVHPVLVTGGEGGLGTPRDTAWLAQDDALQLYRPAYGDEGGEGGEGGEGHRTRIIYRTVYVAPFPLPYQPSACPPVITPGVLSKETIGLILGGVAGGVTGAQIGKGKGRLLATGVGTLLGAIIGREIGASLDRADQVAAVAAEHQALSGPPGCRVRWQNPNTGNSGQVQLRGDHTGSDGRYCREYQTTVIVGGRRESAYGRACMQPDGSWQIVDN